MLQLRNC